MRRCATLLAAGVVLAMPFATHLALATGRFGPVVYGLACAQAAILWLAAWQQQGRRRGLALAAACILSGLLVLRCSALGGAAGLVASAATMHALLYLSLLLLFGQSLRPGATPLVTGLARHLRGTLTPAMQRYTRGVTVAWCGFFLGQLLLSAVLLATASDRVWSLVVNVLDGPMLVAMFLLEFALRRWRFRGGPSPMQVARAFARGRAGG